MKYGPNAESLSNTFFRNFLIGYLKALYSGRKMVAVPD
ncbi:hypothetical protein SeF6b_077 [Salmonella phage SeF6b]|nr:hypothetical protein SeF6b_077 [Salmonella phage SeF6b]